MMPPRPEPSPFHLGPDDQIQARLQISQGVKSTSKTVVPPKAGIHKPLIYPDFRIWVDDELEMIGG
jgi:hypothetical protein